MDWWIGTKSPSKVYHPVGSYNRKALIDTLCDFEKNHGYKASIIVMTSEQKIELINHERAFILGIIGTDIIENDRVFGCDIEVDNYRDAVVIIEEF